MRESRDRGVTNSDRNTPDEIRERERSNHKRISMQTRWHAWLSWLEEEKEIT
jgi:hypothetical protein